MRREGVQRHVEAGDTAVVLVEWRTENFHVACGHPLRVAERWSPIAKGPRRQFAE